jgi:uncharacterized YigZ family protein
MAYLTLAGPAVGEVIVKKSRFIASLAAAKSEEQAWDFIARIRAEHKEASHHVYAFKIGQVSRLSDDGEPSGTAGRPVFEVLDKREISDAVIVVTRYFGGTLLGSGGLVRAYSQAATTGVEAAGIVAGVQAVDLELTLEYALVGKVQYLLLQVGAVTLSSEWGHIVQIRCRVLKERSDSIKADLAEASGGRILVTELGELLVGTDLQPI